MCVRVCFILGTLKVLGTYDISWFQGGVYKKSRDMRVFFFLGGGWGVFPHFAKKNPKNDIPRNSIHRELCHHVRADCRRHRGGAWRAMKNRVWLFP